MLIWFSTSLLQTHKSYQKPQLQSQHSPPSQTENFTVFSLLNPKMATTATLLFPSSDSHRFSHFKPHLTPNLNPKIQPFSFSFTKFNRSIHIPPSFFSTSGSPDPSSPSISYNTQDPPKKGVFLTNEELQKLQFLDNFTYSCKLPSGYLCIRAMKDFELDMTVELLAESFAESMLLPSMYLTVLGFLIKQYLIERRSLMPHAVTLVGFYRGEEDGEEELCGTVEVSFDRRGANASPPTPTPPKNCPYICNMTVKKSFRRRGIGWHLLKASEELISTMSSSRDVYLHCRMIDSVPLGMYKKAGYEIVKTDSFLILLTLQRRKHLMCKELSVVSESKGMVIVEDETAVFEMDGRESEPLLSDEVVQISIDVVD